MLPQPGTSSRQLWHQRQSEASAWNYATRIEHRLRRPDFSRKFCQCQNAFKNPLNRCRGDRSRATVMDLAPLIFRAQIRRICSKKCAKWIRTNRNVTGNAPASNGVPHAAARIRLERLGRFPGVAAASRFALLQRADRAGWGTKRL